MNLDLPPPKPMREKTTLEKQAVEVVGILTRAGHETYLVGGCARDMMLGKAPKDFDIATAASAETVETLFASIGRKTIPIGKAFGVITVEGYAGDHYEIATFRQDGNYSDGRRPETVSTGNLQNDADRRDLTINTIYLSPQTNGSYKIIDPTGHGEKDLKNKIIRAVGNPIERIQEDHLRMLRAIRFAGTIKGATLAPELEAAITAHAPLIRKISAERIFQEVTRMIVHPNRGKMIELLESTGLLKEVLPDVAALRDCMQDKNYHPEGDALTHTIQVLGELPPHSTPSLAWGALLHDVAKPATRAESTEGRVSHHGHDSVGAEMAGTILRGLRASSELTDTVVALVNRHMKSHIYPKMTKSKRTRFLAAPTIQEDMLLHRADCLSNGRHAPHDSLMASEILTLLGDKPSLPAPLVTGRDLLALGIPAGPRMGEILNEIQEQQLEGTISDRETALKLAGTLHQQG